MSYRCQTRPDHPGLAGVVGTAEPVAGLRFTARDSAAFEPLAKEMTEVDAPWPSCRLAHVRSDRMRRPIFAAKPAGTFR